MRAKVGIITIVDNNNYGNLLQNYALQSVIKNIGFDVETIDRLTYRSVNTFFRRQKWYFKIFAKKIIKRKDDTPYIKREEAFKGFKDKYIAYSKFKVGNNHFPKGKIDDYKYFIFGSDQIWNLNFRVIREDIDIFFGRFADKEKKIAYAASFGANEVPEKYRDYVSESLNDFYGISVRETAGVNICAEFLNHRVNVMPDPTLLLSDSEWGKIESKPQNIGEKKYVLTYFLGKVPDNVINDISKFARDNNLDVINLNNSLSYCRNSEDVLFFSSGPEEFVWLIHNCSALITDSFHGTAFAIIFSRPFQVFDRVAAEKDNNMSSRIETILGQFDELKRFSRDGKIEPNLLKQFPDREICKSEQEKLAASGEDFLCSFLR